MKLDCWAWMSSPFMGRGGEARLLGLDVLPIHGEVARSAGGAGPVKLDCWAWMSSPFTGRWREAPEGPGW